jgi:cellulose synthase/poly-beta-1,6-N-acetylglucosamine synthase-like glycosyltransferase
MVVLTIAFWLSLAMLVWTHAAYPLAVSIAARSREREVRKRDVEPTATLVIAAHNEEAVIARRIENLLELDYPADRLEIVVSSDASSDRTEEIALQYPNVKVVPNPRGGKVAAQDRAVRHTTSEIVAFSDANCTWSADALRKLVRSFADPDVAYVCGQLRILAADGSNKEGRYWRYEMGVRAAESRLASITGGNGSIYAIRRSDYAEAPFGHDLSFPPLAVKRGRRAVYEPEALAYEKPTPESADEFRRKVRMLPFSWGFVLSPQTLRGMPPLYAVELLSHRHLRYASGGLHLALLASNVALVRNGRIYESALAAQAAFLALAAAGRFRLPIRGARLAHYYLLMTGATLASLGRYVRSGASWTWEKAEGTR